MAPPPSPLTARLDRGVQAAQVGLLANVCLAVIKLLAGILGNSYALVADAIESSADVFSSLIVWGGLHLSGRSADNEYPFGYGKAEPLAAAVVGLLLVGAGFGVAIQAVREIQTPHHAPASWTLAVLVAVVVTKEILFRRVFRVGKEVASRAVEGDAWHHRSDALTSAAAAVGITVALLGGPGWESADDWAALIAAGVILINGVLILKPAVEDLMDRSPEPTVVGAIAGVAAGVPGVAAIEKLAVRRSGLALFVDIHVQADPAMSLHDAHVLSGIVKSTLRREVPAIQGVLVHMEPFEAAGTSDAGAGTHGPKEKPT
ncbi:MAG: cation diffusion facilitator family transporter [Thermoanaerobaculia bacterium]|nr:cation diffusion facilitator family transporter [Thermoanaerobaculia bacterium]